MMDLPDWYNDDDGTEPLTPEQEQQIKDTIVTLSAGLEQVREELQMPWQYVTLKRINELAADVAALMADWSVYDVYLVGTYLAASARRQIMERENGK
jgi:hypothetical protein